MRSILKHILSWTFSILLIPMLFGQSGFTGGGSAQSLGLGHITTTLNQLSAGFGNHASMIYHRSNGIHVSALQLFQLAELKEAGITGAFSTGKSGMFFGSIRYFGFDLYNELKAGFGYGLKVSSSTSASAQFNIYQFRIDEYGSTIRPGFELGLFTQPFQKVSIGAHLVNPVRIAGEEGIIVPTIVRIGTAYQPSEKVAVYAEVEKDIDHPFAVKAGFEYVPIEQFTVRLGAVTEPASVHFGFGYLFQSKFSLDIGAGYHSVLGLTPGVGLTFVPQKAGS